MEITLTGASLTGNNKSCCASKTESCEHSATEGAATASKTAASGLVRRGQSTTSKPTTTIEHLSSPQSTPSKSKTTIPAVTLQKKPCCSNHPTPPAAPQIIQDVETLVGNKRARFLALCATIKVGTYQAFLQILGAIEAKEGKESKVKELSLVGEDGHTLAHWASKRADDIRFIEYLAKTPGVNLHQPSQDSVGMCPIHWAATEGSIPIVALLLRHISAQGNNPTATPSSPSSSAPSSLFSDVTKQTTTSTSMTSSSSADPINVRDKSGCTPLLIASQYGHADLAAFFIKRNADVNAVDNSRDSALHWAAYKGSVPVCGLLLHLNGIQNHLDQADAFGQTPLHLASLRGNKEVVLYLMEEAEAWSGKAAKSTVGGGSKGYPAYLLTLTDRDGKMPLDLAIKKKKVAVQALLEEFMATHCKIHSHSKSIFLSIWKMLTSLVSIQSWKGWMGLAETSRGADAPVFPFYITLFGLVCNILMYPVYYLPRNNDDGLLWDQMGLHMCFFVSVFVLVLNFYWVYNTDPGILGNATLSDGKTKEIGLKMQEVTRRLREEYDATIESYASDVGTKEKKANTPLCHSCHIARPLRSKHCRVMRKCVLLFDHFCPFVGTTIGLYNYKYFYLFLLSGTVGLVTQIITFILYLHRSPTLPTVGFGCGLFCSLFILPFGSMFVYHTQLTVKNLTTNEHMNLFKYKYLKNEAGRFSNPFDRGFMSNVGSRFMPSEDTYVLRSQRSSSSVGVGDSSAGLDVDGIGSQKDEEKKDLLLNIV